MENARDAKSMVELEREVLRAMCNDPPAIAAIGAAHDAAREKLREHSTRDDRLEAIEALRGYAWRDEEHRVVFEALARVRSNDAVPLREQLPAHATRMGFPDVEWNLYFEPNAGQNDLRELLRELLQRARAK